MGSQDAASVSQRLDGAPPIAPIERLDLTLRPLADLGPDALDIRGSKDIEGIKCTKLQYLEHASLHLITTKETCDLFAAFVTGSAHFNLVPNRVIPVAATLVFKIIGFPDPVLVELQAPNKIRIANPAKASIILAWLKKTRFVLLILLFAGLAAAAPVLDDNDSDDDDDDDDSELSPSI